MPEKTIRIGTRDSKLALWQAELVQSLLLQHNIQSVLVPIKSEGDIDLVTPLYEMGVQGVFTRSLDIALLKNDIDIAVHSMKDVPTQLAKGIVQAAVLKRANYKDILVLSPHSNNNKDKDFTIHHSPLTIATSSIRRKAQWLNRFPEDQIENLRGNVQTRLKKVQENNWFGAIFAAAGLERLELRPENSVELDWMLPAPAQGAIMVVCKQDDEFSKHSCSLINDEQTAICTKIERDFLRTLMGGCSTPISAWAVMENGVVDFKGNICSVDGKQKLEIEKKVFLPEAVDIGIKAAEEIIQQGGDAIIQSIQNGRK
jgi:hydroxymethylbilane synthase